MDPHNNHPPALLYIALLALILFTALGFTPNSGAGDKAAMENNREKEIIVVGDFSGPLIYGPNLWRHLYFPGIKRHTVYSVERDKGTGYLRAEALASASALYRHIDVNLAEYPLLSWRWKIDDTIKNGDARTKAGDDYAARIYLTFDYEPDNATLMTRGRRLLGEKLFGMKPPGSALNYIWANRLGREKIIPSPYTGREMMIAVESGAGQAGQWVTEKRNVYDDYISAFGHSPPPITGIAIMTDSDNTAENATGYYAHILFRKKPSLQ